LKRTATVLAAITASVVFASPAQATTDSFIGHLDSEGISYPSEAEAIGLGNSICSALRRGVSLVEIGVAFMSHNSSPKTAATFVAASAVDLCPDQIASVQQQAAALQSINAA
jgi:hypothetical protein